MTRLRMVAAVLAALMLAAAAQAENVAERLQQHSVTVRVQDVSGSGVLVARKTPDGEVLNVVITAAHVVQYARHEKEVTTGDGTRRTKVYFDEVSLATERRWNGRKVGEETMLCRVLKYSADHDIAVLQVIMPGYRDEGAKFYLKKDIPGPGADVIHVGSPAGSELGAHSVTDGVISAVGRIFPDEGPYEYDQTTAPAAGGSSGGLLALKDTGEVIGIITMGLTASDSFNYYVPVRRLRKWLADVGMEWVIDPSKPVPKLEDLEKITPDDAGRKFQRDGGENDKAAKPARPQLTPLAANAA